MVEELRPEPVQGPQIQRLADLVNPESAEVDARTLGFRFDPSQTPEERLAIATRIFNQLYEGRMEPVEELRDREGLGVWVEGYEIVEKPEKMDEELTEEDRETIRLMNQHLLLVQIPPIYRWIY